MVKIKKGTDNIQPLGATDKSNAYAGRTNTLKFPNDKSFGVKEEKEEIK